MKNAEWAVTEYLLTACMAGIAVAMKQGIGMTVLASFFPPIAWVAMASWVLERFFGL